MKKRKMLFCTIGIAAFFAMSCAMTPKVTEVFDDTVPLEQTAWISPNVGSITSYNEIPVNWEKTTVAANMIQIPAGDTLLEWNIDAYSMQDGITHIVEGVLTSFNFKPQKEYFFLVLKDKGILGLDVYEFDFGKKFKITDTIKSMEQNKVAFIPFLNLATTRVLQ